MAGLNGKIAGWGRTRQLYGMRRKSHANADIDALEVRGNFGWGARSLDVAIHVHGFIGVSFSVFSLSFFLSTCSFPPLNDGDVGQGCAKDAWDKVGKRALCGKG
ncbi:hypothetical protein K439DRAFT_1635154 [Ramaria rubella]|nr:hypothetical protein K439DRAFT_1635154 [Ramaria rubella]